jgi:acyl-CoA hydrolase
MENNINNLPAFVTQTWRKRNNESIREFQANVNENVKELTKRGYNVEIEWLNRQGEVETDITVSTMCRIIEKKDKVVISKAAAHEKWVAEQYAIVEKLKHKDNGEER